jgi:hypothetical protein
MRQWILPFSINSSIRAVLASSLATSKRGLEANVIQPIYQKFKASIILQISKCLSIENIKLLQNVE